MRIHREDYGCIHCHAFCSNPDCNWDAAIFADETPLRADVLGAARKHTKETGHETSVESGSCIRYTLE